MNDKIFIDTNVLIYTQNNLNQEKQLACRNLLIKLIRKNQLVISTQVKQEYYTVSTQKLGLDKLFVKSTLKMFDVYEIIIVNPSIIYNAIDIQILNQLSFWDSLIIAAAISANCTILLSEDLSDGQVINGIKVQNPFTIE